MLRVIIKLRALSDIKGFKKGDELSITNDIFDKKFGVAFTPLNPEWEVISVELLEYKNFPND